jgi:coatomer protein complex subunit gamma
MHLEKATVLQECRVFHDASVVTQNPRKCCLLITKLLFLLVKGESFNSTELTEVFFGVTKLFQSFDVNLRRMMYLFIKEVAETCNPDDVIIVTSSLTKDMNTGEDLYRANSMRVLAKIIDATMLGAIERYLKQAIVDRNAFVASSALMSGLRLFITCPDIVRRWINEVQEAVNSTSDMVQYHALSLLYKIRQHDRLAVSKTVQQLSKGSLRSPLATCLLIRYTTSLLTEDFTSSTAKAGYLFLESCLRHKSDMVIYEAAKAICNLPGVDVNDLAPAITMLQVFLSSYKPALRFAAMRALSEVAIRKPQCVARCNDDMDGLVSDSNRSIATLAITTLLKTGSEFSIDRLMKQITTFMTEIGDEFKIVVVKAIRELCVKYPSKHRVLIGFLATFLREEGGYEFKKSIVDSIVDLMTSIPETKEHALLHLCEFIEDCEYNELIIQILHLIQTHGPATQQPARFIRYIYNRVILESASVRAASVTTLGVFALRCVDIRQSILFLLRRSLTDEDDEVRCAFLYLRW